MLGRVAAERPGHHAQVPPHAGEPALGVRRRGTGAVGLGLAAFFTGKLGLSLCPWDLPQ